MELVVIVLVVLLLFGGGFYGYRSGWIGGNPNVGSGSGFNPLSIVWIILLIILIVWLLRYLGVLHI
jgi:hypothetical protein